MKFLVSIIIPLYNNEEHIANSIQSAINQTYMCKEIIIIDDGSTDKSLAIAKRYESEIVKIFHQENKGASAARNFGLQHAKGKYIQFLDADDLLSPDKIESQVELLDGSDNKIAFCKLYDLINDKVIPKDSLDYDIFSAADPKEFLTHYLGISGTVLHLGVHSWLIPINVIKKAGTWNENLSLDDDGEFILRNILEADNGIFFSSKGGCYYRKHKNGQNLSSQNSYKAIKSSIKAHDQKAYYLQKKELLGSDMIKKRFADGYKWLAIYSYPKFFDLHKHCMIKVQEMGGSKYQLIPNNPIKKFIYSILGWKVLRIFESLISKIKYRIH